MSKIADKREIVVMAKSLIDRFADRLAVELAELSVNRKAIDVHLAIDVDLAEVRAMYDLCITTRRGLSEIERLIQ